MKRNNLVLGMTSLGIAGLSIGLAIYVLLRLSLGWSLVYLAGMFCGGYFIVSRYCAKCPCKKCCPHVITGWLAGRFERQPGAYTRSEMVGMVISVLFIVVSPLIWLLCNPLLLAIYLCLIALAVGMIWTWLCKSCANVYCPVREARMKVGRA